MTEAEVRAAEESWGGAIRLEIGRRITNNNNRRFLLMRFTMKYLSYSVKSRFLGLFLAGS